MMGFRQQHCPPRRVLGVLPSRLRLRPRTLRNMQCLLPGYGDRHMRAKIVCLPTALGLSRPRVRRTALSLLATLI